VKLTNKPGDRMQRAVKALQEKVPEIPFSAAEFWENVREQPEQEHEKHGRAWALQYVVYMERQEKAATAANRAEDAQDMLASGDFLDSFGGLSMGMDDEVPGYFQEELFEQEIIKTLLVDVEEDMGVQQPEETVPWMNASYAISLIEGTTKQEQVDGVSQALEDMNLSFLRLGDKGA
jgi:hypothetical protein